MGTITKPLSKKIILSSFSFASVHGAGWYVRVKTKTTKAARITTIAGPFASHRDAVAFRVLFVDFDQISSIGCNEYDAASIRYLIATCGGEGRELTKLVSPASLSPVREADKITVKVCFDIADEAIRHGR